MRPPPGSTLFPYTTLFRSPAVSNLVLLAGLASGRDPHEIAAEIGDGGGGTLKRVVTEAVNEDRKSTRLNSSHVAISYAVFCLKKKNTTHRTSASMRTSYRT